MNNKVGRPTKYKKHFCELAEALLGMDKHLCAVAKDLRVSIDTLYEWQEKHPEFSEAIKRGRSAGQAVFLDKVEDAAFNPHFFPVNNGMVTLLAVNKYKMVTSKTEAKEKLNVTGSLSVADAVRRRHERKK